MSNGLIIGIDEPNFYQAHRNPVLVQWSITQPGVTSVVLSVDGSYYYQSPDAYGSYPLYTLVDGAHTLRIDGYGTQDGYGIRQFFVDNQKPIINITSPITFDPTDLSTVGQDQPILIYTVDGYGSEQITLINVEIVPDDGYGNFVPPLDEVNDGYAEGFGFIDGYGDRGRIPSGTRLNLRPGAYVMRIIAQDSAGNINVAYRYFSFNLPFTFNTAPSDIWVGSDLNRTNQADSIIEELMIRNAEVSDEDAALDYLVGIRNLSFRTINTDRLIFTNAELSTIRQLAIDILTVSGQLPNTLTSVARENLISQEMVTIESHLNDTNRILLLSKFNVDIEPTDGAGILEKQYDPVIKKSGSSGELLITVLQKQDEVIDKDLLSELIDKIRPAHIRVTLEYATVPS